MATLVQRVTALAQRIAQEFRKANPDGGTAGQVLTKTASGNAWQDPNYLPEGGNSGQVLTKTASGEAWKDLAEIDVLPDDGTAGQVLTVDSSGNLDWQDPNYLPTGGSTGQVLTKTASGETWSTPSYVPTSGTTGYVLTKTASGNTWSAPSYVPTSGTTGYVLTKTSSGFTWQATQAELPTGGTALQALVKTNSSPGKTWKDVVTTGDSIPASQTSLLFLEYAEEDEVPDWLYNTYKATFTTSGWTASGSNYVKTFTKPTANCVCTAVYSGNDLIQCNITDNGSTITITALNAFAGFAILERAAEISV